jgi:hypothetical protein
MAFKNLRAEIDEEFGSFTDPGQDLFDKLQRSYEHVKELKRAKADREREERILREPESRTRLRGVTTFTEARRLGPEELRAHKRKTTNAKHSRWQKRHFQPGRPRRFIDYPRFEALARAGSGPKDLAQAMGVAYSTAVRFLGRVRKGEPVAQRQRGPKMKPVEGEYGRDVRDPALSAPEVARRHGVSKSIVHLRRQELGVVFAGKPGPVKALPRDLELWAATAKALEGLVAFSKGL